MPYSIENIALIRNTDLAPDCPATMEDLVIVLRASEPSAAWDAPDRRELENETEPLGNFDGSDSYNAQNVVGFEVDRKLAQVVLQTKRRGHITETFKFSYEPQLTAVKVTPKKDGSYPIGVEDDSRPNGTHVRKATGSVQEALRREPDLWLARKRGLLGTCPPTTRRRISDRHEGGGDLGDPIGKSRTFP